MEIVNRSGVHRCSICNTVNIPEIETNIGDYRDHSYWVNDPKDPNHFVCGECDAGIEEIRRDYDYQDNRENYFERLEIAVRDLRDLELLLENDDDNSG